MKVSREMLNAPNVSGKSYKVVTELNQTSVMDMSTSDGKKIHLYSYGGQKNANWKFTLDEGTNTYIIETEHQMGKGKYLVEANGKDVTMKEKKLESVFLKYGSLQYATVLEYGAVFLNGRKAVTPLWVSQTDPKNKPVLNFMSNNVVESAGRVEKLVRLRNKTGLTFEQLDWLIVNGSDAVLEHEGDVLIDTPVLKTLAEFVRLNKRYGISSDVYATFIGQTNPYAKAGKKSFYEETYTSTDGAYTIPLDDSVSLQFPVDKQGKNETVCSGAYGVTGDELLRIGGYIQSNEDGASSTAPFNTYTSARMYRLAKIPQMMGLTFAEGEMLLKLMAGGKDTLLRAIGSKEDIKTLDIIRDMEILVDWMNAHNLNTFELVAMITDQYNTTATSDIYNFLHTVYHAASAPTNSSTDIPREQIIQSFAQGFNLKVNMMTQVEAWLLATKSSYKLDDFWNDVTAFFEQEHGDNPVTDLEAYPELLKYCQKLSQYVLITKWAGLSELDVTLMIKKPERFIDGQVEVPAPSLYLLLMLSRLIEWQGRTKVGTDEAMRYFDQVNEKEIDANKVATLLAKIEGWDEEYIKNQQAYLFGTGGFAKNFEQLYTLETWVRLGLQLKISSKTLSDLMKMSEDTVEATDIPLNKKVAEDLMATAR
jgi:hypothetical protein